MTISKFFLEIENANSIDECHAAWMRMVSPLRNAFDALIAEGDDLEGIKVVKDTRLEKKQMDAAMACSAAHRYCEPQYREKLCSFGFKWCTE